MKIVKILFLSIFFFTAIDSFTQEENVIGEIEIISGHPTKKLKAIYIFNGTMVKDSITSTQLLEQSKNYKTKIKLKSNPKKNNVSEDRIKELGFDTDKYAYFFYIVEIKDVILDPENMKLIYIGKQ